MPMDINQQKEQYSIAYFSSIVAIAGYNLGKFNVDDSSIDCIIHGYEEPGFTDIPLLKVQLKCTTMSDYIADLSNSEISFPLKKKNYNDLCVSNRSIPHILVVLIVPEVTPSLLDWYSHSHEYTSLKYCAYWHSLVGESPIISDSKVVHLKRTNVLTPNTLKEIMDCIGKTGKLT